MHHVACPYCQHPSPVAEHWSGTMVCPNCQQQIAVKAAGSVPSHESAPQIHESAPQIKVPSHPHSVATYHPRHRRRSNASIVAVFCGLGLLVAGVLGYAIVKSDGTSDPLTDDAISRTSEDDHFVELEPENVEPPSDSDSEVSQLDPAASDLEPETEVGIEPKSDRADRAKPEPNSDSPVPVLKHALTEWQQGRSIDDYLAGTPKVRSIDLPEWQERRMLATWKIREVRDYSTGPEQRYQVRMKFHDQGVESVTRTIAVKRLGGGTWSITSVSSE